MHWEAYSLAVKALLQFLFISTCRMSTFLNFNKAWKSDVIIRPQEYDQKFSIHTVKPAFQDVKPLTTKSSESVPSRTGCLPPSMAIGPASVDRQQEPSTSKLPVPSMDSAYLSA